MREDFENIDGVNDDTLKKIENISIRKRSSSKNSSNGKRSARIDKTENKRKRNDKHSDDSKKQKKNGERKLTKKQKIQITIAIIAFIFIALGVVFGVYIYKANGNVKEAVLNVATDVLGEKDPIFVLVLGISEDISNELTDTIILAGYNPDSQKAFMVSIPRDTFVGKSEAHANGYDKINALYQKDVEKTVEAVEKLTGINIDNYVVVKNTALPAIVDAIGEVEFDVPIDMNYDDKTQDLHIHLEAGLQPIDGDKAEQLLRFRHNNDGSSYPVEYGDNDYGRMRTQREFIKAVVKKLASWESATKLKPIATAVFNNLETNLSLSNVLGYIPYGLKYNVEDLRMEQLPGASAKINELWFYKASSSMTRDLMDELILSLEMTDKENEKYYTRELKKPTDTNTTSNTSSKNNTIKDKTSTKNTTNTTKNNNTVKNTTNTLKDTNTNKNTNTSTGTHTHKFEKILEEKPATCTTDGKIVRQCTVPGCNETDTTITKATGHNFVATGNKKDATCGASGYTEKECTLCHKIIKDTIPATGKHNFVGDKCSVCGTPNPDYKPPVVDPPTPPENTTGGGDTETKPPETIPPVTNETP